MINVAIIGLGNRGRKYARHFSANENAKVVAICEKNQNILDAERANLGLEEDRAFLSDEKFFAAGKLADVLVVSTQDRDHYGHAMAGMRLGYHLLLEKPVSPNIDECEEIADYAKAHNIKVVVCHVLRYAPFYNAIKETLKTGEIGDIVTINDMENIGYWHFSHSYVRGNWRNEAETSPSILAKCCHDLDLIYYLSGKRCLTISSSGSRKLFLPEKAPAGATDYCLAPCPNRKGCPFDVRKIYYGLTPYSLPKMVVHAKVVTGLGKFSLKALKESLKTSPYGRCVYKCDNDVMENQIVNAELEDGVNANLTMTAFSRKCFRKIHITGTKGEIFGNDENGYFTVNIFGGPRKKVRTNHFGVIGHLGGDAMIVKDFIEFIMTGNKISKLSTIDETLESHRMAYAAEKSRKEHTTVRLK